MTPFVPYLLAAIFGIALSLGVWSVYRIVAAVPGDDRRYLDRPPRGFRVAWPLVRLIVYYLGPRLGVEYRVKTQNVLRRAGVDYSLSPEQFFAGKVLSAAFFGTVAYFILDAIGSSSMLLVPLVAALSFYYPDLWLKEATQRRHKEILRALPFYLDIITLAVEAGTNLTGALTQALQKAPAGPLKEEIGRVLRDVRAGKARTEALRTMADRVDLSAINSLVSNLIQAETMGSSLAPILRAQADQRRTERFQRAEKLAMEAPVKLLAPLIMFIFPNTFLVLIFLLVSKAVQEGAVTWQPLVHLLSWP